MLPIVSKELGKSLFNTIMSQTWATVWGEVTRGATAPQGGRELALGPWGGGICQSGAPNGLGRRGNWWWNVLIGPGMVKTAYLDFFLAVHGLGKAGSQWIFTLEGGSLPLAMAAGWDIAACVGPHCLHDWVLEGHTFSGLPLATRRVGVLHGLFWLWLPS